MDYSDCVLDRWWVSLIHRPESMTQATTPLLRMFSSFLLFRETILKRGAFANEVSSLVYC